MLNQIFRYSRSSTSLTMSSDVLVADQVSACAVVADLNIDVVFGINFNVLIDIIVGDLVAEDLIVDIVIDVICYHRNLNHHPSLIQLSCPNGKSIISIRLASRVAHGTAADVGLERELVDDRACTIVA